MKTQIEAEALKGRISTLESQLQEALKIEGERNALIEVVKMLLDRLQCATANGMK